jgi:ribosome-associated protein
MEEIEIRGDMIRLGQLLKLAGIAGSGSEARALLLENVVTVNGEPESRRGRQLRRGDVVAIGDDAIRLV